MSWHPNFNGDSYVFEVAESNEHSGDAVRLTTELKMAMAIDKPDAV
jgi:hypothetical protein